MTEFLARPPVAIGFFIFAMAMIPLNDSLIKLMSDHLSIFQVLATRAFVCLIILACIPGAISSLSGLSWKTIGKLCFRGICLVGAMLFFFLPLSVLPLAEVTAIFFTAPLLISLLSIPILGEKLGIFRLSAVIVGLVGVLIIVQPGGAGFSLAYLMPVISATSYSAFQIITRYMRNEASVISMVVFQNLIYFLTGLIGLGLTMAFVTGDIDGEVTGFLLRGWSTPYNIEYLYFAVGGVIVLMLAFASTNVYSNVEATYVAPFEYVALPTAILWGVLIWGDWPDLHTWIGIVLILGGGLFMIYRENQLAKEVASQMPMRAATTNSPEED